MNMNKKWMIALFSLAITGMVLFTTAACAPQNIAPTPTVTSSELKVELDVFSGIPNPTWTLSPAQASDLADRISRLDPAEAAGQRPENLGYRGFIVQTTGASDVGAQTIRAYYGMVEVADSSGTAYYLDPQRNIELWLLATAKPPLAEDLTAEIVTEIMKNAP
jgi:hypothetical protein